MSKKKKKFIQGVQKTYLNWSTGKDAALSLFFLKGDPRFSVQKLVTTVSAEHQRVTMHGLRVSLMRAQLERLGLAHEVVELPENANMKAYEKQTGRLAQKLVNEGFTYAAFGDIFLQDLKQYRVKQLAKYGLKCHFPLWKLQTSDLVQSLIELGFKCMVIGLDGKKLDPSFLGRIIDQDFLKDLPETVDPCGENGEFHTFCFDGPIFSEAVPFTKGEVVYKEYPLVKGEEKKNGYYFLDLLEE